MSLVFLFLKVFPAFGLSLGVVFFDLSRSMKRRGNKAWIGMILLSSFMMIATGAWIFFRGDRNADLWFSRLLSWLQIR